jgi:hypothetical protein
MSENAISADNNPIDAVITWVDGSDPALLKKMETFFGGVHRNKIPGAHPTRFTNTNEIRYCVLSILRFASFIRNIYIVTDNQSPDLYEDIRVLFPEKEHSVKIVDHAEIFRGFEEALPTFNSRSIESMIWRIEGLADNFVYFNDDICLVRKTEPQDYFINNRPVLRGKWLLAPLPWLFWNAARIIFNRFFLKDHEYQPRASYHTGQWLSASLLGFNSRYFFFSHTPFAISRRRVGTFLQENPKLLEKNITHRFKHYSQFNFVALSYHLEILDGNRLMFNPDLIYVQPANRRKGYLDKKIKLCEVNSNIKFICIQSLELCNEEERAKVINWLSKKLGLQKIRAKSGVLL